MASYARTDWPTTRISDTLLPWASEHPERPALIDGSRVLSYGALDDAVLRTASWLTGKGIRPGDRLMLVTENSPAAIVLLLASARLGAWAVPVGARLADREIDQISKLSGARRVIYTIGASPLAAAHARRREAEIESLPADAGQVAVGALDRSVLTEPQTPDPESGVAALVYTSGTTGRPKGVMLTHRNLLFMAKVSGQMRRLTPDDRFYGVLPVSHIVGLAVVVLGSFFHGASVYLAARFHPATAVRALAEEQVTIMLGVPSMYTLLAEYAETCGLRPLPHPSLRAIGVCGAPLDPAVKRVTEQLFAMPLHNGYGASECSPTISQTRLDQPRADCSVGRLIPGVEAKIVGADGAPVATGAVGELRVRGPNVMRGYYNAPRETEAVIDAEGWFNTRDLARLDDGNLFIVGRTSELIIRFGFNVYPAEIEAVLNRHPAVLHSAVLGRPIGGEEEIVAFVQPVPGATPSAAELTRFAAHELAPYKRPTRIMLIAQLPLTSAGKIRKAELARLIDGLAEVRA